MVRVDGYRLRCAWLLLVIRGFTSVGFVTAATRQEQQTPPQATQKPAEKNKERAAQPDQEPHWDPLRAAKDMDVGDFYMKKGKIDAAIERFQDAVMYRPNFALPHKRLAEAYEKKGDKLIARKEYEKYLEILPHAQDAKEIRKRLEKLSQEHKGK